MSKKAVVAGASGLVGNELLKVLSAGDEYAEIAALNRKEVKYDLPAVSNKVVDFDRLDEVDLSGVDVVFCGLGTTMKKAGSKEAFKKVDYEYVVELARRAYACKVKTFVVVSADGANADSAFFYLRVKGETEEALKAIGFERLIIVHPSLIYGDRKENRTGEKVAFAVLSFLKPVLIGKLRKMIPVHAAQIARACAHFATEKTSGVHFVKPTDIHPFEI